MMNISKMTDRQFKVHCTISEIYAIWVSGRVSKSKITLLYNNLCTFIKRSKLEQEIDEDYFTLSYIRNELYAILHDINPSGTLKKKLIKKLYLQIQDKGPKESDFSFSKSPPNEGPKIDSPIPKKET
jgi:hypothetical protein